MNDIIEAKTELDLHNAWKSDFTARMVSKSINRKKIPVMSEINCIVCGNRFLARPYQITDREACDLMREYQEASRGE